MAVDVASIVAMLPTDLQSDAMATTYAEFAIQSHDATRWGAVYAQAMMFYTAHMLTLMPGTASSASSSASGPVKSKKAGGTQIEYADTASSVASTVKMSADDIWLLETAYGKVYLRLRNSRQAAAPMLASLSDVTTDMRYVTDTSDDA